MRTHFLRVGIQMRVVCLVAEMIYQPPVKYQLTEQEEEIYRRILDRHRRYVSERNNLSRQYTSHAFQHKHRPKSRFYDQSRTKTFTNTLLNRPETEGSKLTLAEMEQIPAEEFLQLCEKLERMGIRKSRNNETSSQSKSMRCIPRKNRSIAQKTIPSTAQNERRYDSLQKTIKKLLPKLPKGGLSNRDFFGLFMKKAKEAQKISCIKEQIQLEIEYEKHSKIEEIMNARKTAKDCMLNIALVGNVRSAIMGCLELGKKLCETIDTQNSKLKDNAHMPSKDYEKAENSRQFSIENIKNNIRSKQLSAFERITDKIRQFNTRTHQYFQGEMLQSIPIKQALFFVQYLNTSIRELFTEINHILAQISQQLSGEQLREKKQCVLPMQVSTITNSYAFDNFRQIYEQFMNGKQFLYSFYEYLDKLARQKDVSTVFSERKGTSSSTRRRKTGSSVRIC